jgi:hypothetical protein
MTYTGPERRKHPRVSGRFVVSYSLLEDVHDLDISQTRNIGLGGIMFTTNRFFATGTKLVLELRLPYHTDPIAVIGQVLESREVTKNLIYDTRIQFISVDEKYKKVLIQTVSFYLKKGP